MTTKIIPYKPGHLDLFKPKDLFTSEIASPDYKKKTFSYTLIIEEQVVAAFGVAELWSGCGELWALTSDLVHKYPVAFHRECSKLIIAHNDVLKLHRLQCAVKANYEEGLKWVESLEFKKEGLMEKYGPDKSDYYLYARGF